MSRRDPGRKLAFEKTQIRSILSDFRKAKYKCFTIYQQLGQQMPDKIRFDSVERQTSLKMELLDLPGLLALKNTLLKTLSQLFELESQISTKKERIAARRQFGGITNQKNLVVSSNNLANKANFSMKQIHKKDAQNNINEETIPRNQIKFPTLQNVPTYIMQQQTDDNADKLDRISKFVACLKNNMKECSSSQEQDMDLDYLQKQLLMHQPQYCKLKEEVQRYRMREQELENIVQKRIKQGIEQYCLQNMEIIEENQNYKIVKIYKRQNTDFSVTNSYADCQQNQGRSLHSMIEPSSKKIIYDRKKQASLDMQSILREQAKQPRDEDIVAIQQELSKDACNVQDVVSKISSTLENSQMKLKQLREQRKKIFMDDDIWDQFQKM